MNPGRLDTRILIESPAVAPNGVGDAVISWSTVAAPFAEVRNLVGRELIEAQQRVGETDTKFIVRYSSETAETDTKCRISTPALQIFDVLEVLPMPGGRPERIEILAKRRAD